MNGIGEPGAWPRAIDVRSLDALPAALVRLGVPRGRPVLVLSGGADRMAERSDLLSEFFRTELVPLLDACDAAVVDGGTDSGIMRLIGRARDAGGGRFPLVGVVAEGTISAATAVEPHHTHVLRVPGHAWGDESRWIADVAYAMADGRTSATLVVNGGEITYDDLDRSLAAGRPTFVLSGTGRAADAIAAAARAPGTDARANRIAGSPLITILDINDPVEIIRTLERTLHPTG